MPPLKRVLPKLGLSFLGLGVLLVAGELILRGLGYANSPARYFDPDIGYRFHPDQTRPMYGEGRVELGDVTINALGLRGPVPLDARPAGMARIACLGDSFTFGWAVEDDETYPAQLAARIREKLGDDAAEVLNFGLPGHNTENEVAAYEHLARPHAPDVAILGFYLNDLEPPFPAPAEDSWLQAAFGRTALLEFLNQELGLSAALSGSNQTPEQRAYIRAFHEHRDEIYLDPRSEVGAPYLRACLSALEQLIGATRADGTKLLIVAFPARFQVNPLRAALRDGGDVAQLLAERCRVQAEVRALAEAHGVPFLDLMHPFVGSDIDPYGKVDKGHPSPAGYTLAAHEILRSLRAQKWL